MAFEVFSAINKRRSKFNIGICRVSNTKTMNTIVFNRAILNNSSKYYRIFFDKEKSLIGLMFTEKINDYKISFHNRRPHIALGTMRSFFIFHPVKSGLYPIKWDNNNKLWAIGPVKIETLP